jgi:hypothetical protein
MNDECFNFVGVAESESYLFAPDPFLYLLPLNVKDSSGSMMESFRFLPSDSIFTAPQQCI